MLADSRVNELLNHGNVGRLEEHWALIHEWKERTYIKQIGIIYIQKETA